MMVESKNISTKERNTRNRKRKTPGRSAWKSVSLVDQDDDNLEQASQDDNHYDNPKLRRSAAKDLPVQPGEDVAMCFGLEVLDGSQYQMLGTGKNRRMQILTTDATIGVPEEQQPSESKQKKRRNEPKPEVTDAAELTNDPASVTNPSPDAQLPSKKKKKKKEKKKKDISIESGHSASDDTPAPQTPQSQSSAAEASSPAVLITPDQLWEIQQSWSQATGGAVLHQTLLEALFRLRFARPTPIQAATLTASILGRRNLVGAAPTGSGKTLAFLLPILQTLLEQPSESRVVQALIVTPTRELALQIHAASNSLLPNKCAALVGGIALVKQTRILQTKRPPILVGTPGRLWAMLSSGEHDHLKDLSRVRFLILDEADRMTQDHSFPQLVEILARIHDANPGVSEESDGDSVSEDDVAEDRMLSLPGIRGEASLVMMTPELLEQVAQQRAETAPFGQEDDNDEENSDGSAQPDDKKEEDEMASDEVLHVRGDEDEDLPPPVHRQTFIYSATLTLPYTSTKSSFGNNHKHKKISKRGAASSALKGGIAEILERCHAMGDTKVVDLSSSTSKEGGTADISNERVGVRLPPGLRVFAIKCTQRHKDSHLYAYLMTTAQGSSGPCLVFCNSIGAVRRVGATLQTLGLPVRILHASMQQRARFKAVESLNDSATRAIVVCTDVAARGLDIPSVATVVHYDVSRAVDGFVHRAGRTARGMGEGAVGSSLSLISAAEDKAHSKIVEATQVSFSKVLLDGRLLTEAQERVNLASKIVVSSDLQNKVHSQNQWFLEKAEEAEIELDDDLVEDETNQSERELSHLREAKHARIRLTQLLGQPMRVQRFGKFLSTNSAAREEGIPQM